MIEKEAQNISLVFSDKKKSPIITRRSSNPLNSATKFETARCGSNKYRRSCSFENDELIGIFNSVNFE